MISLIFNLPTLVAYFLIFGSAFLVILARFFIQRARSHAKHCKPRMIF